MKRLLLVLSLGLALLCVAGQVGAKLLERDVSPVSTGHDTCNQCAGYPVVSRNTVSALAGANTGDDFANLIICQFGPTYLFPSVLPTLGYHISTVVCMGAEEKMIYVDAGSVVAIMTDAQTGGYRPIYSFPSESVGQLSPPPRPQISVSLCGKCDSPHQAARFSDLPNVSEKELFLGHARTAWPTGGFTGRSESCRIALHSDSFFRKDHCVEPYSSRYMALLLYPIQTAMSTGSMLGMRGNLL
jgi:hypothetical protein